MSISSVLACNRPVFSRNKEFDCNMLTIMEVQVRSIMLLNNPVDFEYKAKKLASKMDEFRKIVLRHPKIQFGYMDVLKRELSIFKNEQVAIMDNFTSNISLIPFDNLANKSSMLYYKDGSSMSYDENKEQLKLGNPAIGQGWIGDTEVFCPRNAINHSLNSSILTLGTWIVNFKTRLNREGI